jgi:hypothetical protein
MLDQVIGAQPYHVISEFSEVAGGSGARRSRISWCISVQGIHSINSPTWVSRKDLIVSKPNFDGSASAGDGIVVFSQEELERKYEQTVLTRFKV